jgi:predicted nucleotidyltransferase
VSVRPALSFLTPKEHQAVMVFLERLRRDHGQDVQRTVLFGSKARGDSAPDSDIYILIVVAQESWPLRDAISLIASRVSLEYGVLIGPRVIGQERWRGMARDCFSFYRNVESEGVPLSPESA